MVIEKKERSKTEWKNKQTKCDNHICMMVIMWKLNTVKSSQVDSHVRWFKSTDISETDSVASLCFQTTCQPKKVWILLPWKLHDMYNMKTNFSSVSLWCKFCVFLFLSSFSFSRDEWNEAVKTLTHWLAHLEVVRSLEALEFCRSLNQQGHHLFRYTCLFV
jgi:hypothetical protein